MTTILNICPDLLRAFPNYQYRHLNNQTVVSKDYVAFRSTCRLLRELLPRLSYSSIMLNDGTIVDRVWNSGDRRHYTTIITTWMYDIRLYEFVCSVGITGPRPVISSYDLSIMDNIHNVKFIINVMKRYPHIICVEWTRILPEWVNIINDRVEFDYDGFLRILHLWLDNNMPINKDILARAIRNCSVIAIEAFIKHPKYKIDPSLQLYSEAIMCIYPLDNINCILRNLNCLYNNGYVQVTPPGTLMCISPSYDKYIGVRDWLMTHYIGKEFDELYDISRT
jgi:hypothetical protein